MKTVCVFVLLALAACSARPQKGQRTQGNPQDATILQFENNNIGVGPYSFAYQTSDGMIREETAEVKNPGTENEYLEIRGSYSYIGADGQEYKVTYTADKNGFQPQGTHIHS